MTSPGKEEGPLSFSSPGQYRAAQRTLSPSPPLCFDAELRFARAPSKLACFSGISLLVLCIIGHSHSIIPSACAYSAFGTPFDQAPEYPVNLRLAIAVMHRTSLRLGSSRDVRPSKVHTRPASTVPLPWRQRMHSDASEQRARGPGPSASDLSWQRASRFSLNPGHRPPAPMTMS
jgi:hypothetical protein